MGSLKNHVIKEIKERKKFFKELPFHNVPTDKPNIKKLTNAEILLELHFMIN